MKNFFTKLVLYVILFIGLSLLLYPSFADWWNSYHSSQAIANYSEQVANMDDDRYAYLWDHAWDYNQSLLERPNNYILTDKQKVQYEDLLDISGNGIMGYVEIPHLDIILPIYHGTNEAVLQIAVGHLEWTSLPVGGTTLTVLFPDTEDCPAPVSLQIWIRWQKEMCSCCVCWMKF
jgi:sortase A